MQFLFDKSSAMKLFLLPKNNESVFYRLPKADLYRRGWAGAPLSRFLEGLLYKCWYERTNERMNYRMMDAIV